VQLVVHKAEFAQLGKFLSLKGSYSTPTIAFIVLFVFNYFTRFFALCFVLVVVVVVVVVVVGAIGVAGSFGESLPTIKHHSFTRFVSAVVTIEPTKSCFAFSGFGYSALNHINHHLSQPLSHSLRSRVQTRLPPPLQQHPVSPLLDSNHRFNCILCESDTAHAE
jgi:hypothetical protein